MPQHPKDTKVERKSRQLPVLKSIANQGKRPRGIERKQVSKPVRKSARLQEIQYLRRQPHPKDKSGELTDLLPSLAPNPGEESPQKSPAFVNTSSSDRKRKRAQEAEDPIPRIREGLAGKRRQTQPSGSAVADTLNVAVKTEINHINPIEHWIEEGSWPKEYFEQDSQLRKHLQQKTAFEEVRHEDWFKEQFEEFKHEECFRDQFGLESNMSQLLARQKSLSSLRRKKSDSGTGTPSDELPRELKSAKYRTANYTTILATKGSFLDEAELGITDTSKEIYQTLLDSGQAVPTDSLFRDDRFKKACRRLQDRNEAKIIQDISRLIVPSAETLATYGSTNLNHLIESVNEGWNSTIPFYGSRPQPDYSVGFGRSAFTRDQLEKLTPFVGEIIDTCTSYFMGTWYMYFPFLTCEVKCGATGLDIADRQNAHSMTVAVRGVVELFRLVKREKELHREILAFSISHDHETVRMYGHYAVIEGNQTIFYRHPIRKFNFTELDGREKWTAYKFTKNVYDKWMPAHLKKICSAIDQIPSGINFEPSQAATFSQDGELPGSGTSNAETMSGLEEDDRLVTSQQTTPDTSITQEPERVFKKPRNRSVAEQQQ